MAQVPDKVLAWLYSVLHVRINRKPFQDVERLIKLFQEYNDPQRTYSDAARTLSSYPSLRPRTEVYTYETGAPALLLTLSGTLPVSFRGSTYKFPVKLWVPQAYPQEAPMAYVTAENDMIIRPGQHVGVDGRIYHPYLRDWSRMWDRASMAEFLEFLQQVFTKEPPVISRAQQQQFQRPIGQSPSQQQSGASPAPPQLPPKQRVNGSQPAATPNSDVPPPRPPKPGDSPHQSFPQRSSSRNVERDGPPLPPLPHEVVRGQLQAPPQQPNNDYIASQPPQRQLSSPNGRPPGPPLPPLPDPRGQSLPPMQQQQHQQYRQNYERSPVSPVSPMNGYSERPNSKYSQPAPLPQQAPPQQPQFQQVPPPPQQRPQSIQNQPQYQQQYQRPPFQQYANQPYPPQQLPQQPPQPQKQPPPDLLSDPFDIALPGPSSSGPAAPAPPIPPNPEKEHLLHALSTSFVQQIQEKVHQNLSAIGPLQAQQNALRVAHGRLEGEIRQLEQLDQSLASNEAILHRSIQDCDRTITTAKSKPPPPIDEVLIAPTMVANQLWTLCAEEAACREAMYVLQKAVDRGRVNGNDFVRQMRSLGRECFLKMVLARKCARGLGLDVHGR